MGFARDGLFFPFDFLCDIFFFLLSLMSMISPGKFSFFRRGVDGEKKFVADHVSLHRSQGVRCTKRWGLCAGLSNVGTYKADIGLHSL